MDATGAGDCLASACLSRLARGAAPADAARQLANMAAALSTRGFGAVAPLRRRADLMAAGAAIV